MNRGCGAPDPAELELEAVLADYDYDLPDSAIAQSPMADREAARLLLVAREDGARVAGERDHRIADLPDWLAPGDLLVRNATRVLPARLLGRKASGGLAEALLLGREERADLPETAYRALVKCTGRLRTGLVLTFRRPDAAPQIPGIEAEIVALHGRGEATLVFADAGVDPYAAGIAPLPPYIHRAETDPVAPDLARYQTVFAREPGAVAAPTAGLHLTQSLFERLEARGVAVAEVVLHVGAGTFRPLDAAAWRSGRLHRERFELPAETALAIERTRASGGRVIAVGTTTTRALESRATGAGGVEPGRGETDLFVRPGMPIRVVDGLLTNFHLPRSSLLMLVATLIGREATLARYREAVAEGFRFFSYGDAMLILPDPARGGTCRAG